MGPGWGEGYCLTWARKISLHSVNQTIYKENLRSFECRTDCFVALLILKVQVNSFTSGHCREVETRVNEWTVHQKKMPL